MKAPWTGGVYDRVIGNLKGNLYKLNLGSSLFLEEFSDHIYKCVRVINDRPLQQARENEVITLSMLL